MCYSDLIEGRIADWPVAVPMVDMHTIGAGGGSVASLDAGGLLQVGPESAGAMPAFCLISATAGESSMV